MKKKKPLSPVDLDGSTVKVVDGKLTYLRTTQFTDGDLLDRFTGGNREAIKAVCATVAKRLAGPGLHDPDVIAALIPIFAAIGDGVDPSKAFKIPRHAPTKNTNLRDYEIKMSVKELMQKDDTGLAEACDIFSKSRECTVGFKSVEKICAGLTKDTVLQFPDDIFPIGR